MPVPCTEHPEPASTERVEGVAHGWNIDMDVPLGTAFQYNRFAGVERTSIPRSSGTLLGPEGTAAPYLHDAGPGPCSRAVRLDTCPYLENCTVDASIFAESSDSAINLCATERSNRIAKVEICGQVTKGARWMPWHQEPMKDVGGCDKPRGAANRAVIRGCPNGETRLESCPVTLA